MCNQNSRLNYIDGYKGIACFCIMMGHFMGIYKYSSNTSKIYSGLIDKLTKAPFSFFTNENFWIVFFMFSSGYLCTLTSKGRLTSYVKLLKSCVARFIRLAIPIFFSGMVIFIVQILIGFHNMELEAIIHNTWFTGGYGEFLDFKDIIFNPFKTLFYGICDFTPPHWCLREILCGSLLIYVTQFLSTKIPERNCLIFCIILLTGFSGVMIFVDEPLIIVMIIGSFFACVEEYAEKIVMPTIVYNILVFLPILAYFLNINSIVNGVCFGFSLYGIKHTTLVKSVMSNRIILFLGQISWGIFSYHWPIISSIGAETFLLLYGYINIGTLFAISMLISVVLTILIGYADYKIVAPITRKIVSIVK